MGRFSLVAGLTVALLGVLVARILTNTAEGPCLEDPHFSFEFGTAEPISLNPCNYFSETYQEARSKFREAAQKASAELYALEVVPDYTTDVAVLRGSLPGLVVHSSGVHGIEAYAGSAIQIAWLTHFAGRKESRPTMVFLHAINPYGMAHYRRWNENNVDLNRNALHPKDWEVALARDPNIAGYQDFDETMFNQRRAPTNYYRYIGFWLEAANSIVKNGLVSLKRSMVAAQYHNPKGIFYGGQELQPSWQNIWNFFETHTELTKSGKVTWVDVHTGLGKSGQDTILNFKSDGDVSASELANVYPGAAIPSLDKAGSAVHDGYDLTMGFLEEFVVKLFSPEQSPWIVSQEFGTVPLVMVARAMILENMAYHYLPPSEAAGWTSLTRSAFYVRTPEWRQSILNRGLRVLLQSLARSSQ